MRISLTKFGSMAGVVAAVVAAFGAMAERPRADGLSAPPAVWFDDLTARLALSDGEAEAMVRAVAGALARGEAVVSGLPERLARDAAPRIVFLSLSDGRRRARVAMGTGRGFGNALGHAAGKLRGLEAAGRGVDWLKVDVVRELGEAPTTPPYAGTGPDLSLHGIAFPRPFGLALLAEELQASGAQDRSGGIVPGNMVRALRARGRVLDRRAVVRLLGEDGVRTFTADSFFLGGGRFFRLYRGHEARPPIDRENVLRAARQGGAYLARAVDAEGRFAYSYLPTVNRVAPKYNMVRHAGTIYAMLELYALDRDPALLRSAQRAIRYQLRFVKDFGAADRRMSVLAYKGKIKLGGVALTVVALAKYTEVTKDDMLLPVMRRLARYIVASQRKNGRFISQRFYPSGKVRKGFDSQYYPGEAMLALLRLHALDPLEKLLDATEAAARYLIEVRDSGIPTPRLVHDHWLLYALNELYRRRPRELYMTHALRIARAITLAQNRTPPYPDYLGSFYNPPRSTPTATRMEGLLAAYSLARDFGRVKDADRFRRAIRLGIGFQLRTRFGPAKAMYMENPERPMGGFHRSLTNFEIRIDYVQHNLSALLAFHRLLGTAVPVPKT